MENEKIRRDEEERKDYLEECWKIDKRLVPDFDPHSPSRLAKRRREDCQKFGFTLNENPF